jgi:general stress protein 26
MLLSRWDGKIKGGSYMEINYKDLEKEIIMNLEKNKIWVLSTSYMDQVTSRSMSITNIGLDIYFQTHISYVKYNQMQYNKNVSLCFNNISIEGIAEEIGSWKDDKNKELMQLYKSSHQGSFEKYGALEGQIVFKIKPQKVKLWKYLNGKPFREILYIDEKIAEQLDFI